MAKQIRWRAGPAVLLEIRWRADHGVALRLAKGNHDHVAGDETRSSYAEVEPVGNDVHQATFGHQIDMHLRVTPQKLQHQRQQRRTGCTGERIDAQDTGRSGIVGSHRFERCSHVLQGWSDLFQVQPAGLGQRHATCGAVEQPRFERRLQFGDGIAQRGSRHIEVDCRLPKRGPACHSQDSFQLIEAEARVCHTIVLITGIGH
ncbi:hypothetical protein D3C84_387310 [compost metagenome]